MYNNKIKLICITIQILLIITEEQTQTQTNWTRNSLTPYTRLETIRDGSKRVGKNWTGYITTLCSNKTIRGEAASKLTANDRS
jgi:hypothetical protein